ncbi:helix-turn-helix domain-containing protein [Streptomyces sp. NPDC004610]|uniref:helix-turn-helix domain-containing protein n=2 Tax=Streptomyces TaxID=1883 RepID=UPI0033B22482
MEESVESRFMDAQQTADFLNMSLTWVYRDARRCGLRAYRFGTGKNAKIQFKTSEVLKWIEQQQAR